MQQSVNWLKIISGPQPKEGAVTVLPLPQLDLPMQAKPSKPSAEAPVKPTKDWLSYMLKDLRVDPRPRPASRAHYAADKEWEGQSSQPKLV